MNVLDVFARSMQQKNRKKPRKIKISKDYEKRMAKAKVLLDKRDDLFNLKRSIKRWRNQQDERARERELFDSVECYGPKELE